MAKRIIFFAIAVLILGALCLFIFTGKPPPEPTIRRADGSVLTLAAVTYGTNHMVVWGKPHQRELYKLLPAKFRWLSGAIAAQMTAMPGATNLPMFWVYDSKAQTNFSVRSVSTVTLSGPPANVVPSGSQLGMRPAGIVKLASPSAGPLRIGPVPALDLFYRVLDELWLRA